eukprot:gene7879-12348_t
MNEEVELEVDEINHEEEEAGTLTETFNFEEDEQIEIDLNELEAKEKKPEVAPKEPMDTISKRLLISNITVFIFFSIQSLILAIVGLFAPFSASITLQFTTEVLVLFITALHHLAVIILIRWDIYKKILEERIGYFRWFEYSISSGFLIICVGIALGISNLTSLILLFFLNLSSNIFALAHEKINNLDRKLERPTTNWHYAIISVLLILSIFLVFLINFVGRIIVERSTSVIVDIMILSLFLVYILYPINFVLSNLRIGPWATDGFDEMVYMMINLFLKTIISWQLIAFTALN